MYLALEQYTDFIVHINDSSTEESILKRLPEQINFERHTPNGATAHAWEQV